MLSIKIIRNVAFIRAKRAVLRNESTAMNNGNRYDCNTCGYYTGFASNTCACTNTRAHVHTRRCQNWKKYLPSVPNEMLLQSLNQRHDIVMYWFFAGRRFRCSVARPGSVLFQMSKVGNKAASYRAFELGPDLCSCLSEYLWNGTRGKDKRQRAG